MLLKFNPEYFGLDISKNFWRFVACKKIGGKIVLTSFNEINVPEGVATDDQIIKTKEGVEIMKKLVNKAIGKKNKTPYISVCLPESKTFIKLITIPNNPTNLNEAIVEEAKKHIPYPLEKTYLDFQITDPTEKNKVLIGVVPKEIVANFENFLNQAGFSPLVLEIEAMAIARAVLPLKTTLQEPIMVIDLGASRSGLFVAEKNHIAFNLSLNVSGEDITNALMKGLQLDKQAAEQLKINNGLISSENTSGGQILKPLMEKFNSEILAALEFYKTHFSAEHKITKLLLTGSGANLKGLPEFISAGTGLNTEIAKPDLNIVQTKVKIPPEKLLSYTTAIGLALRQFN